jgi:sister chromatid cohesion protein DCC1
VSLHRSIFVFEKIREFFRFKPTRTPLALGAVTRSARSEPGEMDDDPPQGLGWFAEAHNLQEGEKANVVLGEDFHTNEVELLNLNDELLKVIEDGGELMFKGGPDDEAVLCTDRTTYAVTRVETSNTLLLFQPPGGLPTKVRLPDGTVDDIDADADDPDDRDPTVTPLPKRRKTDDDATGADGDGPPSTPAEAINRAMKDGVPLGEDGLKDIVSFAQASSHLEVVKCEPRLGPMWERLRQAPHAYAGPEREAEPTVATVGIEPAAPGESRRRTSWRTRRRRGRRLSPRSRRVPRFATRPTATGGGASTRRTRITFWTCSWSRRSNRGCRWTPWTRRR